MVTASAEAFLSTQGALARVHEVAEELPASWGLVAAQPLGLGHTAHQAYLRPAGSSASDSAV